MRATTRADSRRAITARSLPVMAFCRSALRRASLSWGVLRRSLSFIGESKAGGAGRTVRFKLVSERPKAIAHPAP